MSLKWLVAENKTEYKPSHCDTQMSLYSIADVELNVCLDSVFQKKKQTKKNIHLKHTVSLYQLVTEVKPNPDNHFSTVVLL